MEKRFCEIIKIIKLAITINVLLLFQACSNSNNSTQEEITIPLIIEAGTRCVPVKINNKSQVLMDCGKLFYAIWSKDEGFKKLPPPVRPDRNYSFANAINANGDIVLEISSPIDPQHPNGLSKILILHPDLSFQEVFPEAVGFHVSGITVNDHNGNLNTSEYKIIKLP